MKVLSCLIHWKSVLAAVLLIYGMGTGVLGISQATLHSPVLSPISTVPSIHPGQEHSSDHGLAPSIQTLTVGPTGTVYAGSFGMGMFRSENKGQTWEPINTGLFDHFILCLAATSEGSVFAGTMQRGVFRLPQHGSSWLPINQGLGQTEVKTFLVYQGTVYAGTGFGVFQWEESQTRWLKVGKGLEKVLVPGLAMTEDGILLAATAGKGLYRFDTHQNLHAPWVDSRSIFVDPRERLPHRYLRAIAVNEAQHIFLGTQDGGIFRSLDHGHSWSSFSRNLPNNSIRSIVPLHQDVLVATGKGVFRWMNSQQTWLPLNAGLTKRAVQSLTLAPMGDWYAGTSSGAFLSLNEGRHWHDVSSGFGVQLVPKHPYE